jgi:hypothetical protein
MKHGAPMSAKFAGDGDGVRAGVRSVVLAPMNLLLVQLGKCILKMSYQITCAAKKYHSIDVRYRQSS